MAPKKTFKQKFKETFSEEIKFVQEHTIGTFVLILGTLYLSGIISLGLKTLINLPGILDKSVSSPFTLNPIFVFKDMFTSVRGYLILIVIIFIEYYLYNYVISPRIKKEIGIDDERNFKYSEKGTYGTSSFIRPEELSNLINIFPVGNIKGDILGKPTDQDTSSIKKDTDVKIKDKTVVFALPSGKEYDEKAKKNNWGIDDIVNNKLNNHKAVFGASGTMKSRAVARNFIIQAALRGESIVITDPKGELYEDMAVYLREKGYDVKMFNLVDQEHSDSWNCLSEILDKDGKVNSTSAKIFADTIVLNASGESDYWSDNARNILKAVCMLVAEDPYLPTNLGTVYDIISQKTSAEIDALFKNLDPGDVARRSYEMFGVCTDQVKGQILNGLGIMIDVFQDDHIRNITSSNEISLTKPATEKCAYFCITSDQHKVFDFLAVLFYAMMFIKLVEEVDSLREVGHEGMGSTIPINLILDEFPNIGQIPDFCKKISTVRSRNINITVIFQNIVQMQNRYPYGQWEEILGNCDTTIFLGCTDQTTADYISGKTGIASIEVTTQNSLYQRDVLVFNQATDYHEVSSVGQRKVMNSDEVLRIKNTEELIFFRGQKPLKAKKFDYTLHPEVCKLKPMAIKDHIPEWKNKMIEEEKERERKKQQINQQNAEKERQELEAIEVEKKKAIKEEKDDWANLAASIADPNSSINMNKPNKFPKKAESPFGKQENQTKNETWNEQVSESTEDLDDNFEDFDDDE